MEKEFKLGQRRYRRVGASTLEHDHYLAGRIRKSGSGSWEIRAGESAEDFGARILGDVMEAGTAFDLLGGLLIPVDEETWTKELAERTAREMAGLTDPAEKKIANMELLTVVGEFFAEGLAFWLTSVKSSGLPMREDEAKPAPIGGAESSEIGVTSSG